MRKKRTYMDDIYERHKNLPLPPEYKVEFFSYAKLFFKWMDHINRVLDVNLELSESVTTAAGIKKCEELKKLVNEVCYLRDTILVSMSMMVFIGFNRPTKKTLEKFRQLRTLIDDNILSYMAVIQRYTTTIREKKRLSLKGLPKPMSSSELQNLDCWPTEELMDSCFVNGTKIMAINAYIKEKNK